jgi:hypothetical protein
MNRVMLLSIVSVGAGVLLSMMAASSLYAQTTTRTRSETVTTDWTIVQPPPTDPDHRTPYQP